MNKYEHRLENVCIYAETADRQNMEAVTKLVNEGWEIKGMAHAQNTHGEDWVTVLLERITPEWAAKTQNDLEEYITKTGMEYGLLGG